MLLQNITPSLAPGCLINIVSLLPYRLKWEVMETRLLEKKSNNFWSTDQLLTFNVSRSLPCIRQMTTFETTRHVKP